MNTKERWLLPEGIDELMPAEAEQLELLHRNLIDMMQSWGYQLVVPPLVEYLDSLLTGTAKALDLQTFKLTDQMSGRMLGIRADITPQVARIAAHKLRHENELLRLCYIGGVLNTLPQGQGTSRNPIQLGAEIYGHQGFESDVEIMQMMVSVLRSAGIEEPLSIDIGHVGVYRGLAEYAGLNEEQEQELFAVYQRKALPEIESLLTEYDISSESRSMLLALAELHGGESVLTKAEQVFANAPESVKSALETVKTVALSLQQRVQGVDLHFDLAELRGYDYHTGLVFAAYQAGSATAIASGGRYDDIGAEFGHAQPATGFSLCLKTLAMQLPFDTNKPEPIFVEWQADATQQTVIDELRSQGETVIYQLPDAQQNSIRQLVNQDGHWVVAESGTQDA
jgi:ATP phosphoribosyltransferase regulatory subunit